jgi:hypothetical protein
METAHLWVTHWSIRSLSPAKGSTDWVTASCFDFRQRQVDFLFSETCRLALGLPSAHSVVTGGSFPESKLTKHSCLWHVNFWQWFYMNNSTYIHKECWTLVTNWKILVNVGGAVLVCAEDRIGKDYIFPPAQACRAWREMSLSFH